MPSNLTIYLIGCFLSYICLKMCDIFREDKTKLSFPAMCLGVISSWVIVLCVLTIIIRTIIKGIKSRKNAKKDNPIPKMNNAEMLKCTIDNYWVKAVQSDLFDQNASLPIKESTLCKTYYMENTTTIHNCLGCPVHKMGFGCNKENSLWQEYAKISGTGKPRQVMAVKLAMLFESIYKTCI